MFPHLSSSSFDTVPFPAAGLSVKMQAHVAHEGDYRLVATMPKADHEIGLIEEAIPCSLAINILQTGQRYVLTSMTRYGEYGFGNIQYYKAGGWHLKRGDYDMEIQGLGRCEAAVSRGAALSIEAESTHATERFLAAVLGYWSGITLLGAGLLGLVWSEFGRANKALHATAAPPGS